MARSPVAARRAECRGARSFRRAVRGGMAVNSVRATLIAACAGVLVAALMGFARRLAGVEIEQVRFHGLVAYGVTFIGVRALLWKPKD